MVAAEPTVGTEERWYRKSLALSQIRDETSVRVSLESLNYLSTISSGFFPVLSSSPFIICFTGKQLPGGFFTL